MGTRRIIFLLLALTLPGQAATLFVSPDGDGSDGSSWETAFPRIRDAVVASATGDEIWIAPATFH